VLSLMPRRWWPLPLLYLCQANRLEQRARKEASVRTNYSLGNHKLDVSQQSVNRQ
jgi:hypothetical protein